jgi:predicted Zn-dependent protease
MKKVKNLDLILILAGITVLAIVTAIILWTRPYEARSLEEIKTVNINNYKTMNKNEKEYFVLLFDSKKETPEYVVECVLEYVEYARNNGDAPKLYVIDYNDDRTITNSENFNISSGSLTTQIPCLATISTSGSVTNKKTNSSDICNLLEDYMNGRK